ncbi:MAG: bifunctional 2-keto-4-hydroxyglutarate aldolase/2-keto-3-deoxy-6-phosphogluconate aldolase [Massilibacillus sp.]|jgi:2-dehydro-3-deoxyphosphogluconate aldolase/(4S)-4-hydroxy-2-oxoglutarate aldolase|nr:bifunctional 2-keto-4-hydroxyglutarate aldolase/2-keto-3-deoxy-6-phosphogluconate aldolase [Massilibacillus sp.]
MEKEKVIAKIKEVGVVAVIRGDDAEHGVKISDACIAGGVTAIEVAFTTPRAHETIKTLVDKYKDNENVVIGAGTVLDPETARIAILNGAEFVVSPSINLATIKLCNRYRVACMPGTTTIEGVLTAMEAGADIVKIFPGEIVGTKLIKAIKGPVPQAQLMPTGGVSVENLHEWLDVGCVAVGAGGSLTGGAKTGDYQLITDTAVKFIEAVKAARK